MTDENEDMTGKDGELTLEGRLKRLEEILTRLESDEIALEDALTLFEEGVGHVKAAEGVLAETELRVEELLASGGTKAMDVDSE